MAWEKRDINASGLIDLRCWIRSRQMAGQGDHAYLVAGALVDTPCTLRPASNGEEAKDDQLKLQHRGYVSIFGPRFGAPPVTTSPVLGAICGSSST